VHAHLRVDRNDGLGRPKLDARPPARRQEYQRDERDEDGRKTPANNRSSLMRAAGRTAPVSNRRRAPRLARVSQLVLVLRYDLCIVHGRVICCLIQSHLSATILRV
jgi:hypothetical protein